MLSVPNFFNFSNLNWKSSATGFRLGKFIFESYLYARQYRVLKGLTNWGSYQDLDHEYFGNSQKYSQAKLKYNYVKDIFDLIKDLFVIKFNVYAFIWKISGRVLKASSFLPQSELFQTLIFSAIARLLLFVYNLPLGYYFNFVLEEKFNFNRSTIKSWLFSDLAGCLVQLIIDSTTISLFLKTVNYFGKIPILQSTMLTAAIFFTIFTIYPTFILPLFFKASPLPDGELRTRIEKLAVEKAFQIKRISVLDASTYSSHSNAMVSGFPWRGEIALSDTLLEDLSTDEVVSVVAHELGHLKLFHILKQITFISSSVGLNLFLLSKAIQNKSLYEQFGFSEKFVVIGFLLFQNIAIPLNLIVHLFDHYYKQKLEYEADYYSAIDCGLKEATLTGLSKIFKNNLNSLDSDWLFNLYHRTHPSSTDRLEAVRKAISKYTLDSTR
ncbi:peptidase family M48-domain-containing protein [Scheffersomyces amazonensis]|uniref:peptidase family M48-domain-containing protein n=1 Tax=Scheffersomyces amazonensis TaxID=1078765 RepID=UPI00315CF32C